MFAGVDPPACFGGLLELAPIGGELYGVYARALVVNVVLQMVRGAIFF
jgi:hypothetical protein